MARRTTRSGDTASAGANREDVLREFVAYIPSGDTIPDETWRRRHRNIIIVLLVHVPFLFLLGTYEGTESAITGATLPSIPLTYVLGELGVLVGFAALARMPWLGRRTRTAIASLGMVTASAFLVHFSGGYIEAHFHFFVVMGIIAVYEDWLPFALGIAYVAVQHGYFGMIDPSRVYNHAAAINNPWVWAIIHATFVLGLAGALMSNWYSTERSRENARQQLEAVRAKTAEVDELEEKNAEIEQAKTEAQQARAEAKAKQQEVERLNEKLEALADAYSADMARAAEGDLTVRLDTDAESEAMAQVAGSFNEMIARTEGTITEIQDFAARVATATEEADAGTREATEASEEISDSIRGIADRANDQRETLEAVSEEMTDLSATVQEVAASAETVAETSRETAEIVEAGETTARGAIDDIRQVQSAIDTTVENVRELDERMAEIGEIVEFISDIAEQTNMLALNANIEAARAGNGAGGEGFAVVAEEVKGLAEETRESATEIEQLIERTQAQTDTTVTEAREANERMQDGVEAVEDVVEVLSQVADNAGETDSGIQEISETTDDQAASTAKAASMIEDAAELSRATAGETENASAAAREQAGSMSEVSANVDSLSEQAERLEELLAQFDVNER